MPKKYRSQSGIVSWLTNSVRPVFMLDHRWRVRFFNLGCVELTGCQPEDVIGKSCEYRSDSLENLSDRVLNSLTPPAEVFQGQELFTRINFIDSRGEPRSPHVLYLPLFDDIGELTAVIGILLELADLALQLQPSFSQQLHSELAGLMQTRHQRFNQATLIARSPAMRCVSEQIQVARGSRAAVHLRGDAGTGKEYIARMIHQHSDYNEFPFLLIECSQLPRTDQRRLLKDALTHAGELSTPGAIFLKDVEKLSLDLQVWLAQVIEQEEWPAQYRLFSSSTQSLQKLVEQDQFDSAFFFAIDTISMTLPTLTERVEDFELLCQYFVEQNNQNSEKQYMGLTRETLDEFQQYAWPGNVRELKLVIQEACKLCEHSLISIEHLPFRFQTGKNAQQSLPGKKPVFRSLSSLLESVEKAEIVRALEATKGNKAKAAELLGLTRAKLYRCIETLEIEKE